MADESSAAEGPEPSTDRLSQIKKDLARRLRPICPQFSDAEFAELIQKMAANQIAHEMRGGVWGKRTRPDPPEKPKKPKP